MDDKRKMVSSTQNPRYILLAAACWNYFAAGAGLLIAAKAGFAAGIGLKSADPLAWELFAACVLVFGIGYHWASTDAARHRNLIILGAIGKPFVFAACAWNFHLGNVPLIVVAGSIGDLIFGLFFLYILMAGGKQTAVAIPELEAARYLSIPKIAFDLALWFAAGYFIRMSHSLAITLALAFFIGAIPLHDLLVQGHEGTHGLISRLRWANELFGWLTLAPVFISCAAHRIFHMRHHDVPHQDGDPEYEFFNRVVPGVPGWAFMIIPAAAPVAVNWYAWRHALDFKLRLRIALELAASLCLHAALAFALGLSLYGKILLLPIVSGLAVATFLRAITEHHGTARGDEWKNSRSVRTNKLLAFLWSNVNYHLEHHLYPGVPYHRLPAVQQILASSYTEHHANIGRGYVRTATSLLRQSNHFGDSERKSS
jgi:fatty acid desaturase